MKMTRTLPKTNDDKSKALLAEGWLLLKEKSLALTVIYSVPLLFFLVFITIVVINQFSPLHLAEFGIQSNSFSLVFSIVDVLRFLLVIIFIAFLHEIIHLVLVPGFFKSNLTFFGITWFGGFTYTEEIITRSRFIVISIMPFLLISIVGVWLFGTFNYLPTFLKVIFIFNAAGSSMDFYNVILVLLQTPKKSNIKMNGKITFYK